MNIDPYILAFSAITVIVTIWMGFWSARKSKTASDFFVAGRSVSVGWNASAISGEYLSAASFMGVAGMVMSSGYDALWYPVCYACGYLFLLLFIAGPLRRFGAYTIPDFAEGRFDSPVFRKIAVCFVLFIGFFYTMPQMKGAGTTLAYIFPGLPYWAGVVLVGAVITLNVALGGMKGITLVQAFQYWAKMFAISVPIFVLMAVYGHYGEQLDLNGSSQTASQSSFKKIVHYPRSKLDEKAREVERRILGRSAPLLKYGVRTANVSLSGNPPSLDFLLPLLGQFEQKSVYLDARIDGNTRVTFPTDRLDRAAFLTVLTRQLDSAGIAVSNGTHAITVFHTNNSWKSHREPLPEKAPNDETWLSPFGPLTTKAAKAAASGKTELDWSRRSQLSDPLPFVQQKPNLLRDLDQFTEKFGSRLSGGLYAWNTNEPVWMVLSRLKSAAGVVDILCDTNLLLKTVAIDRPRELRADESVSFVEGTLKEQGISIIRASKQEWWAVPAAELQSYFKPFDTKPYALLYTYSLIIALVCGTAGLPHILVRFYTNPDGVAAKRTTMWVMILIGIFYVFPPVFGVLGRNLMPELYNGLTGVKGTDGIVLKLPTILREKYGVLGSILSGVTCAGAFAAFMSTFSGLLVSMTGALAHDVYGRMLRPKSTPENRLRAFKICAVLIGGVAIVLGCFVEPLEINFMVGQAFAIAAASYFPLLFMSVWWRGMTMRGAAVGMLSGGLCALGAVTLTNFSNLALDKGPMGKVFAGFAPMNEFWAGHPLLRILCEQPAIWTVPLAISLMIIVGKLTRKEVPSDVRMKMLVLHAPEKLGLKQEYIQEHQHGH